MPTCDRDPIEAVKALLGSGHPGTAPDSVLAAVGPELRELQARLARARQVEGRVSLSKVIEALVRGGEFTGT